MLITILIIDPDMGYGFKELPTRYLIRVYLKPSTGEDFDEAIKRISQTYKVDTFNSKPEKEKDVISGGRDYPFLLY